MKQMPEIPKHVRSIVLPLIKRKNTDAKVAKTFQKIAEQVHFF